MSTELAAIDNERSTKRAFTQHAASLILPAILVLIYAGWSLIAYRPYLESPWMLDDDHRQHLLAVYADLHPEDFREQFLVKYARAYLPPLYEKLLCAGSTFCDPLVFCKWLGMGLLLYSYVMAFFLGRTIGGPVAGLLTLALVIHSEPIAESTYCGLFRSFSFPLGLTLLYGMAGQRNIFALGSILVSAFLYPPAFMIFWLAYALWLLPEIPKLLRESRRPLWIFLSVSVLCATAVGWFMSRTSSLGERYTRQEAREMPEWNRPYGRLQEFPIQTRGKDFNHHLLSGLNGRNHGVSVVPKWTLPSGKVNMYIPWLWLMLLGAGLCIRPIPYWLVSFFLSGIFLYWFARQSFFTLGWPDRYLLYNLPLVMLLLLPLAWGASQLLSLRTRILWRTGMLLMVAIIFLTTPLGLTLPGRCIINTEHMRDEWKALQKLPSGSLLAGWPTDLDNIPILSHKEVLVNFEHAYPLYKRHYTQVSERMNDNLRLIFATNAAAARIVVKKYGLTHAFLNRTTLSHDGRTPGIFAPFNNKASAMRHGSPPTAFLFNHVPEEYIIYKSEKFFVVDLARWLCINPSAMENL